MPRRLPALVASLALLAVPSPSLGDSMLVTGGEAAGASASLNFRIIIPAVMRVMENSHPLQLTANADGALSGEQRLVVLSNLKRGFCVNLRLAVPGVDRWQLHTPPASDIILSPAGDGYRVCSARPGRYTLVLQHQFGVNTPGQQAMHWPVQTDISAI
ncbi:hypothetical protein B0E41_17805 [Hydrogenophaga sp. A37]|nr:hypothetical protein B0E41_17805 [Hydrogenophaga sp. A37]